MCDDIKRYNECLINYRSEYTVGDIQRSILAGIQESKNYIVLKKIILDFNDKITDETKKYIIRKCVSTKNTELCILFIENGFDFSEQLKIKWVDPDLKNHLERYIKLKNL